MDLRKGRLPGIKFYLITIIWFACVMHLSYQDIFKQKNGLPVSNLQLAIILPMIVFWIIYYLYKPFKKNILAIDFLFLNAIQLFRVLGLGILIVWGFGMLPGGFALPMSILDASVGILALFVIMDIYHEKKAWFQKAKWMNIWGFSDFFLTILLVFIGKPLSIDPEPMIFYEASILELPLSMFPGFAIGYFSCIHFMVFIHLSEIKSQ